MTLDTNLLHELWENRQHAKAILQLIELAQEGKVDLAITARVYEDVPSEPLVSKLKELPDLGITETGSVARLDFWVLGRDMLGAEGFDDRLAEAQELARQRIRRGSRAKPPDWRDWDHLHAHFLLDRDYFVTLDSGMLCIADELRGWFGVIILKPEDALQRVLCQ